MTDRETTDTGRRDFIKRVSIGAAFAAPIVTSFSMSGLSSAGASMAGNASNGSNIITPN